MLRWCTHASTIRSRFQARALSSPANQAPPNINVFTYNPKLMEEKGQQIANISGMPNVTLRLGTRQRPRYSHHLLYNIDYHPGDFMYRKPPFPENLKGFFYYFQDKSMPPISGSLRFRVCEDLAGFDAGHDLLSPLKEPWAVPLIKIVRDKVWSFTLAYLIRDGQVDEGVVRSIKRLRLPQRTMRYRPLFIPSQPFSFDLRHRLLAVNLMTRTSAARIDFQHVFYDRSLSDVEGVVKVAFELSRPEPQDGPALVLRILDVLSPIKIRQGGEGKCNVIEPGQLLQRVGSTRRPWTYSLSRPNGREWLSFIRRTERWCSF